MEHQKKRKDQVQNNIVMSYIDEKHPPIEKRYEVISDNKENYSIHTYVCNVNKIKIV